MFEGKRKNVLAHVTAVFAMLFVLSCVVALCGCSNGSNTIQNHKWKFDNVQGTANDGAVIACSEDSQWVSDGIEIIDLSIQIEEGSFTIVNLNNKESFEFSYNENNSLGKSTIYDIENNGTKGIASVSKTTYQDKTEIPTLIISIKEYNLYFYEK